MTRFARMPKKTFHEATEWGKFEDPSKGTTSEGKQSKNKDTGEKTESIELKDRKIEKKKKKRQREDKQLGEEPSKVKKSKTEQEHVKTEKGVTPQNSQKHFEKKPKNFNKLPNKNNKTDRENAVAQFKKSFSGESKYEKKLEKQREARRKRRAKQKGVTCFHCRELGHRAADCPQTKKTSAGVGVCYKCGATSHITKHCKVTTTSVPFHLQSVLSVVRQAIYQVAALTTLRGFTLKVGDARSVGLWST
ncbi:zinc finger CCHC domain-containing protein 9 isoform X2 [Nematostella vectensis]|uniref:zinc finger CCHC domain-containing protein 9 isoform X2 n=1 Tax=Nematostella vectensis TaxID=45351 RepID=UPI00139057D3|nr:zinc finger CCHC domain-containing protein 9 isoform X2 [Nematostella vectensis]